MNNYDDFFDALSEDIWDEKPVSIEEFVTNPKYLGEANGLSENQYKMVRAGTQIFRKETLIDLYGEREGSRKYREETFRECIFVLGKASGKDFCSNIICLYIVYLLLCLKNPQKYYDKPQDDNIDILNVAVNSDQAKNVFFKGVKNRLKNCPWFDGKYETPTQNGISFIKSINLYSGHSERESFEGLNLFLAVLDEISAFADTENESPADTYNTYRDSVDSRFPDGIGKVLLLSFPRKRKGDFIMERYNEVVHEKQVVVRRKTLKLDPDLPDNTEGNEFEVSWDEDHIIHYKYPMFFALKRPTWEVNPFRRIEQYTVSFHQNMPNALAKYACMPTDGGEDAFIRNPQVVDDVFVAQNLVDSHGVFADDLAVPKDDHSYFIHVDLSKVHDRCAVAVAHVENWVSVQVAPKLVETLPVVKVDMIRWWEPSKEEPMDYKEVTNFIKAVRRRGYRIKGCTLDRWNSHDTINHLNAIGIPTSMFSVKTEHYNTLATLLYDQRLVGPNVEKLKTELKQLIWVKEKVDHPSSGYKDMSDAITGAINNAIINTPVPRNTEVEAITLADLYKQDRDELIRQHEERTSGVIKAPVSSAPPEIQEYMQYLRLL